MATQRNSMLGFNYRFIVKIQQVKQRMSRTYTDQAKKVMDELNKSFSDGGRARFDTKKCDLVCLLELEDNCL